MRINDTFFNLHKDEAKYIFHTTDIENFRSIENDIKSIDPNVKIYYIKYFNNTLVVVATEHSELYMFLQLKF